MNGSTQAENTRHREFSPGATLPVRLKWLSGVSIFLSLFVLGTYLRHYDPRFGWTKMSAYGVDFAKHSLPRLQRTPHDVVPGTGQDGQFYAQMALDPSVRDPAFDHALDNPVYRARRIGLPVFSFCLGWAKPRRVIQVYALSNLIFWFVLLGASVVLYRPWTGGQMLCLAAGMMSFGSITSMQYSFIDLPAAAMIMVGLTLGTGGRYASFAAAVLTRETSLLAAVGCLDLRWPFTAGVWKRNLRWLLVAALPFAVWLLYIGYRFDALHGNAGNGNFAFPLRAMTARFAHGINIFAQSGLGETAKAAGPFGWLYLDESMHELLTIVALFCQGLYLVLRRNVHSEIWRTGVCFAVLGCILGSEVWSWTAAAARVLLPMTLCFYLLIAKERDAWFWPFAVLGSLSIPYGVYDFCVFS